MWSGRKGILRVCWLLGVVLGLSVSLPLSAQVNLTGAWSGTQVDTPQTEPPVPIDASFTQNGAFLTGRLTFPDFGGFNLSGAISGTSIFFDVRLTGGGETITINYRGTITSANTITGTWTISDLDIEGTFRLDRAGAPPPPPPPPVPSINSGGVVNNASYALAGTSVAPGTIAAVFGTNLTDGTSCTPPSCFPGFEDGRLKTTMAGASVAINGIPSPLFYATPNQIGVQIPTELTGPSASVVVTVGGQSSAPQTVALEPFSPGIFTFSQDGRGAGAIAHADGTPVSSQNPALPNEVVIIYATGLGQVTPAVPTGALPSGLTQTLTTPTVTVVDGLPAEVQFSGLSGCCVGLNQINVKIPGNTRSGNGIPVVLTIGGKQSNPVTIAIGVTGTSRWPITSIAIDPTSPRTIYASPAGTNVFVFKSTNGGESWSPIFLDPGICCATTLVIDPVNTATLYATGTFDATGTFYRGVFKSTTGGQSWTAVNPALPNVIALAIDAVNTSTVYAATERGLYLSTDGGQTWPQSEVDFDDRRIGAVVTDPAAPGVYYFAAGAVGVNAAFVARCQGFQGSSCANAGLSDRAAEQTRALVIDPANTTTLYAGTAMGIFKGTMVGAIKNWSAANVGLTNTDVRAIVIDPTNSATIYAATSGGGVFKSTDGAETWSAVSTGLSNTDIRALAIDPLNPVTIYAGTDAGVYKSTNGGGSWSAARTGLGITVLSALPIAPSSPATP